MAGTRGYHSYRGRGSKGKAVLAVVLVLVILVSVGFMMLQKYIVYDETGTPHLMLPEKEAEETAAPTQEEEDLNLTIQPSAKKLETRAFTVTEAPLTLEGWVNTRTAAGDAVKAAVLTMKNGGKVFFDTQTAVAGSRASGAETAAALTELLQGGTAVEYAIARFSCFHDSTAAQADVEGMGLKNTGGYIFYDGNNSQWLDPGKSGARQYLCTLAAELAALGFDEILLTDVSYPTVGKLDKIDYGDAMKARNLQTFLEEMKAALEPYEVRLSIELPEGVITDGNDSVAGLMLADIAPLVDRIYAVTTAEQAESLRGEIAALSERTEFVPEFPAGSAVPEGSWLRLAG